MIFFNAGGSYTCPQVIDILNGYLIPGQRHAEPRLIWMTLNYVVSIRNQFGQGQQDSSPGRHRAQRTVGVPPVSDRVEPIFCVQTNSGGTAGIVLAQKMAAVLHSIRFSENLAFDSFGLSSNY